VVIGRTTRADAESAKITTWRRTRRIAGLVLLASALVLAQPATSAFAVPASVGLGTAGTFSVLAASTVTNTGPTVVSADAGVGGNLGVSPQTAITGFPPGVVTPPGTIHSADAVAAQAQADLTIGYNDAAGRACDTNLTGQDLGGLTLTSGVYCFDSSAFLTGTLTLDAQGNPDAVFIFQIGSTLITSVGSAVVLTNGGQGCHVFWQVGSSATLGTGSAFTGNILALASITATTNAAVEGRLLARTGAVTLDKNAIHTAVCAPQSGVAQAPLFGSSGLLVTLAVFIASAGVLVLRRRTRVATIR
jgi:hypothetical protein